MKLLFCASAHGWNRSHFHKKRDGKSPTVTLYLLESGVLIGGFTVIPWGGEG